VYDAVRAGFRNVVLVIRREVEDLFRRHVADVIGSGVAVSYAHQALDPAPPGRTKPWGTGHAVLAAAWGIRGPFAVMNADDYYGAGAFRLLFDHLASAGDHALVGYTLRETMSAHGGVSRAIAELDAQGGGYLSRLTEVADIVGRGSTYTGRTIAGETVTLDGSEFVSMNLWGFTPALLPTLERQFGRFLEARGTEPTSEFLLSEAVGAQVRAGDARVRVLPPPVAGSQWFGMTYSADDERVRDRIASLVNAGQYPTNLKAGLERLGCD
jgi:nucleotidyltransferase-like protein